MPKSETRTALKELADAAREVDRQLRAAWDARLLPASALSGPAAVALTRAIQRADRALAGATTDEEG